MKKLIYVTLMFGACTCAFGQYAGQASSNLSGGGGTGAQGQIYDLLGPISERTAKHEEKYADFQGSPYLDNSFVSTTMFYGDEKLGTIFYRHNALNDEVEIKKTNLEEEPIRSLSRDKEVSILVDGKKMSFHTFVTAKKKTLNGYLTKEVDGETYSLYKRNHVKYTEGAPARNSFVKAVPSRFTQYTEYYLHQDGVNRMDEISLKNSKLIKLVDASKKEGLKNYLKENNLNIKNEADLLKAFGYLNM